MASRNAIQVRDLHKHFGSVHAIDGATFSVPAGSIFGFLGPNGAGKTTTIQCFMNFINPDSGTIRILGHDTKTDGVQIRSQLGYLPSSSFLYDGWTGRQHIEFAATARGVSAKSPLIERFRLDVDRKVKHLSTGNRQKLQIVLTFLGSPKLVIMDEPTSGLDPLLQNKLYGLLRDYTTDGGTVFMSSHNLPEVEKVCDGIAVIRAGKIVVEETLQSLRSKSIHHVTAVFDEPVLIKKFERPGVDVLHHAGHMLSLRVKGDLTPTMQLISKQSLKDLEVSHASLEEIFLEASS